MADATHELIAAARAFREALRGDAGEHEFARQVRNTLARVYLAAALLGPPAEVELDEDPPDYVRREDSRGLEERLAARFGESNLFVDVYDPTGIDSEDAEACTRVLSAELIEIDEDLDRSIDWLEQHGARGLWDIRWSFENHWGQHALACLRPLHQLAVHGVV
jgi:hypothetical protein